MDLRLSLLAETLSVEEGKYAAALFEKYVKHSQAEEEKYRKMGTIVYITIDFNSSDTDNDDVYEMVAEAHKLGSE